MYTCGSSFQSWSEGRHQARVSGLSDFSHSDLERTARDVAAIETNVDRMNSIFPWDESDRMLVCRNTRMTNDYGFFLFLRLFFRLYFYKDS